MKREEIEAQIQKEMDEYLNSVYQHPLPVFFLDGFEKAIMEFPQNLVPYRSDLLKDILGKKNLELLSIYEVGFVATVFLNIPPKYVAKDVYRFLEKRALFEAVYAKYDMLSNNKKRALQLKASTMAENNRERIIPANAIQMPKR